MRGGCGAARKKSVAAMISAAAALLFPCLAVTCPRERLTGFREVCSCCGDAWCQDSYVVMMNVSKRGWLIARSCTCWGDAEYEVHIPLPHPIITHRSVSFVLSLLPPPPPRFCPATAVRFPELCLFYHTLLLVIVFLIFVTIVVLQ